MMSDPIGDMLTRLRNAQAVGEKKVKFFASKVKLAILSVLEAEGYIEAVNVLEDGAKRYADVVLKYHQGRPVIEKIKRVSRPGLRVYKDSDSLPIVRAGMGEAIVSTSKGVMTAKAARAQHLGGEVLCTVE